jgi:predicted LPLAT superfamily acyltransferase
MRVEQYEIWVLQGKRWTMSSAFLDFEFASAIAKTHVQHMRLIHAVYEEGAQVQQNILAEMGATREKP